MRKETVLPEKEILGQVNSVVFAEAELSLDRSAVSTTSPEPSGPLAEKDSLLISIRGKPGNTPGSVPVCSRYVPVVAGLVPT